VTDPAATTTLQERAAALNDATKRITARNAAAADAAALDDALMTFSKRLDDLRPALAQARALREHGVPIAAPTNGAQIAEALRELAERIDSNPVAVRQRQQEIDRVDGYTSAVQSVVDETLRKRLGEARGGAEAGIVQLLRKIALDDAADKLESALATLDAFEAQHPRSLGDLEALDAAAKSIRETIDKLEEPEYNLLIGFVRRTYAGPQPTLADIDPDLFGQLQSSGAAANFVVRLRER
jgi:hypothetical protein